MTEENKDTSGIPMSVEERLQMLEQRIVALEVPKRVVDVDVDNEKGLLVVKYSDHTTQEFEFVYEGGKQ